jgi:hypothetical protein
VIVCLIQIDTRGAMTTNEKSRMRRDSALYRREARWILLTTLIALIVPILVAIPSLLDSKAIERLLPLLVGAIIPVALVAVFVFLGSAWRRRKASRPEATARALSDAVANSYRSALIRHLAPSQIRPKAD